MGFTEKFGSFMNDLDKKLENVTDKVNEKIDENLTEEKKAEYSEKADKLMDSAEKGLTKLGGNISKGLDNLFGDKSE